MVGIERSTESRVTNTTQLLFGSEAGNYFRLNEVLELTILFDQKDQPLAIRRTTDTPIQLIDKEGRVTNPEEPLVEFNHQTHDALIIAGIYCLKFLTPPQGTNQGDSIARIQVSWPMEKGMLQVYGR